MQCCTPRQTYISGMTWGVQPEGQANLNKVHMALQPKSVRWHKPAQYVTMVLISVKVQLSLSMPERHRGGVAVQLHSFLTSTLRSTSHPSCFTSGERSTWYPQNEKLTGPQSGSGNFGQIKYENEGKISTLLCKWNHITNRPTSSL